MTFLKKQTILFLPVLILAATFSFSACKNHDTVDEVKVTPATPTTAPMNNSLRNVDSVGMMNATTSGGNVAIANAVDDSAAKAKLRTDSVPRKQR